jgi:hypothetical protein
MKMIRHQDVRENHPVGTPTDRCKQLDPQPTIGIIGDDVLFEVAARAEVVVATFLNLAWLAHRVNVPVEVPANPPACNLVTKS